MSDLMLGGQESGTPLETRGLSEGLASALEGSVGEDLGGTVEGLSSPFQRMATQAQTRSLGFDPALLGTESAQQSFLGEKAEELVASPGSQTAALFDALKPFEEEQTERQVAGVRQSFGNLGGRFSSNQAEAEADVRGELAKQFRRSRAQELLSARDRQLQGFSTLMNALNQSRRQGFRESFAPFQQATQFGRPGKPQQKQGMLPGLLSAGATLFAASQQPDFSQFGQQGGGGGIPPAPNPGGFGVDPPGGGRINPIGTAPPGGGFASAQFDPRILGQGMG